MKLIINPLKLNDVADQKEYPFEVVIFSGKAISTCELGKFVIDLQSLQFHKKRMAVNYNHDLNKILGYIENFRVTEEGLVADGMLINSKDTAWFIEQARNGVPFEVSAEIDETQGTKIELAEGTTAEVNGNTVTSDTFIYKNVPFLGTAICPHGADRYTRFTLLKQETTNMSTKTTKLKTEPTNLSDDKTPPEKKVTNPELAEFIEVFGKDRGLDLYQEGVKIEDVRKWKELKEKFDIPIPEPETTPSTDTPPNPETPPAEPPKENDNTNLSAVITELKKTITGLAGEVTKLKAAVPRGESEPVSHGVEKTNKEQPEKKRTSIDRLAASYKK
jgi:hypothetical protein